MYSSTVLPVGCSGARSIAWWVSVWPQPAATSSEPTASTTRP